MNKLEKEILIGEETLNYKVEFQKDVFFSVIFVNKDLLPNETMKVPNNDLVEILDKIALMFIKGVELKLGMKIDFEKDIFTITDIYVNFKNDKINIEYSLL
jgi:hypothetical protein